MNANKNSQPVMKIKEYQELKKRERKNAHRSKKYEQREQM
jgi:hypothetical protein